MSKNNPQNIKKQEMEKIHSKLIERYGQPEEPKQLTGTEYLVETILSQNTNDINRDKAFNNLQNKYNTWEEVENAPKEELTDTVRVAGLGPTKSKRIQKALKTIRETEKTSETYSIDFLSDMKVEKGKKWLTEIPGIGSKTASVILCFHFRKPVIPVDTHVHRIAQRFKLVPENCSRNKTHEILEEIVPDTIKYSLHILLITHGRETCKARNHVDNEKCFKRCQKYQELTSKS